MRFILAFKGCVLETRRGYGKKLYKYLFYFLKRNNKAVYLKVKNVNNCKNSLIKSKLEAKIL